VYLDADMVLDPSQSRAGWTDGSQRAVATDGTSSRR
jgi:hypothetical protein